MPLYFRFEDNPQRAVGLLDWLDDHPEERDVIFDVTVPVRGETLTQGTCYARAALHLYSSDDDDGTVAKRLQDKDIHVNGTLEDALAHLRKQLALNAPDIDRRLIEIFMPFSMQIKYHIQERWKKVYQAVNKKIMEAKPETNLANILRLEDIEFKQRVWKVEGIAETESLPAGYIWDRLHKYWRDNPTFNQYFNAKPRRTRRRRTTATAVRRMLTDSDEMSNSCSDSEDSESERTREIRPARHRRGDRKSHARNASPKRKKSHSVSEISTVSSKTRHESYKHRRYSATHGKSDYRVLELQVQLKRLENEALEKQAAAELQRLKLLADMEERKRKHELKMKVLADELFMEE